MTEKMCYRSDMDPGSSLGIGPRIERCGKLTRNTPGDIRRKIGRLAAWNARGYQITGISTGKPPVSDVCTVTAQAFRRLTVGKPPMANG
ncbi:hypothetical protein BHE74_00046177 [Ensete ventricosum]|nr:hypothetical protein BHE74_00046177 [Ensete ventricosum]RZS17917.1 hypothetical protein BHM03_00050123 [Ensete ventricosum]